MKQTFVGLLVTLMAMSVSAQELEGRIYGRSVEFSVSNPAGVVAAMTQFNASEAGQNFPANVLLNQIIADGESDTSHTVDVFYASAAGMDQAASQPSMEGMRILSAMQASADLNGAAVFTMDRGRGLASEPGTVTQLFSMEVTDAAAFNKALDKLWDSKAMKEFPGGVYQGTFFANGTDSSTHWVPFVAKDMATLTSGMDAFFASPAMGAYLKNASDFRTVTRTRLHRTLLAFRNDG